MTSVNHSNRKTNQLSSLYNKRETLMNHIIKTTTEH